MNKFCMYIIILFLLSCSVSKNNINFSKNINGLMTFCPKCENFGLIKEGNDFSFYTSNRSDSFYFDEKLVLDKKSNQYVFKKNIEDSILMTLENNVHLGLEINTNIQYLLEEKLNLLILILKNNHVDAAICKDKSNYVWCDFYDYKSEIQYIKFNKSTKDSLKILYSPYLYDTLNWIVISKKLPRR